MHRSAELSCPGCGLVGPEFDGPTHPYLGASAACWAIFGEVTAREYGEWRHPDIHRLTVDVYAVQHPGIPEPRAIRSVCGHLIAISLELERRWPADVVTREMSRGFGPREDFHWLEPPEPNGFLTIADVAGAADLAEHERWVHAWADSVWTAWAPHYETIRGWADAVAAD